MNPPSPNVSGRAPSGAKFAISRQWPRFHVQLPVEITTENQGSEVCVPGLVGEISRRGLALYAGIRSEPGERMHISFQTSNPLQVSAIVRNCTGYCLGLEFLSVETNDRHAALLEAFLERHDRYLQTRLKETDRVRQRILKIRQAQEELESRLRRCLESQPCARP